MINNEQTELELSSTEEKNNDDELISAKAFGQRLKLLRIRRGWEVADIAEKVGIHRSTFAGYETQEKFPPIDKLSKISKCLNTSTDYLIGLTDDPTPVNTPKNVDQLFKETKGLHWNGIPLTEETLKPLAELFNIVIKERFVHEPSTCTEQICGTEDK